MPDFRYHFQIWVELWEVDDLGNRFTPANDSITAQFNGTQDVDVSIDKSISSNLDSAQITIHNHIALEKMYSQKLIFFQEFFKKDYEIDILMFHRCPHFTDSPQSAQCIFSGDLDDIYASGDGSITDQSLVLNLTAGKRASVRSIVNTKYPAGTSYLDIVIDLFTFFGGYDLTLIDDPLNKLSKITPKPRTVHGKVSDILNDIARDMDMTWGFDSNPWTLGERRAGGTDGTTGFNRKRCYWVDKKSVFDVLGVNGVGAHNLNGSTGKIGRIGYTKSQFTLSHIYDPVVNIGMSINASDFGTMNEAVDFLGRVTRMNVNNDIMSLESSYIGDDGLAVINFDKKHTGGWVL